jgi:hypothetical protein
MRGQGFAEVSGSPALEELGQAVEALKAAPANNRIVAVEPRTDPAVVSGVVEVLRTASIEPFAVEERGVGTCGINAVMHAAAPEIRTCYENELIKDPELKGRLVVRFAIDRRDGRPLDVVRGENSTLEHGAASECILDAVRALDFPPSPGEGRIHVRYPFIFEMREVDTADDRAAGE